ncbi:hypothetical protein SLEP1_g3824 [Rubroshorea leprosula]|uniref:Uncharacterized protein n=1 Tax=Rubroshorea leprosula TaxID=152421 RepID=A0AAV5HXI0_9ROSI|nr:hypothetical protein SLEP1_g3824 [Rubroshorea leprosula]
MADSKCLGQFLVSCSFNTKEECWSCGVKAAPRAAELHQEQQMKRKLHKWQQNEMKGELHQEQQQSAANEAANVDEMRLK